MWSCTRRCLHFGSSKMMNIPGTRLASFDIRCIVAGMPGIANCTCSKTLGLWDMCRNISYLGTKSNHSCSWCSVWRSGRSHIRVGSSGTFLSMFKRMCLGGNLHSKISYASKNPECIMNSFSDWLCHILGTGRRISCRCLKCCDPRGMHLRISYCKREGQAHIKCRMWEKLCT